MSRQQSYGGYGDLLLTAGGDRALAIEYKSPLAQRAVSCSASCYPASSTPTAGMLAGFARLLLYIGSIPDLTDLAVEAATYDAIGMFGLSRVLSNVLVPMGKDVQLIIPQVQSDGFHAQPGETLGAALLLPVTQDPASSLVVFNAYGTLNFYGTPIDNADNKKYKVV